MTIRLGTSEPSKIYRGSTPITRVYAGSQVIWPVAPVGPVGGPAQDYTAAVTAPVVTLDTAIADDADAQLPAGAWVYPASSTSFKYLGADAIEETGSDDMIRPNPATVVSYPSISRAFSAKFNFTGLVCWVRVKPVRAGSSIRVRTNNGWDVVQQLITSSSDPDVGSMAGSTSATALGASGAVSYVKIQFSEAGPHTIQLDMNHHFGGVYVPTGSTLATDSVGSLPLIPTKRVMGMSGSLFAGVNPSQEVPYNNTTSLLMYATHQLGWNNVYNESLGGGCYSSTAHGNNSQALAPSYLVRLQNATVQSRIAGRVGDVIIWDGGNFNDIGDNFGSLAPGTATSGAIFNWVNPVMSYLRTFAPDTNAIAVGVPLAPLVVNMMKSLVSAASGGLINLTTAQAESVAINGGNGFYGLMSYNNVLRQIAAQHGVFYFEPLNGRVYDPTGALIDTVAGGMFRMPDYPEVESDQYPTTYMSGDGVHPTKVGNYVLGNYYAAGFAIMKASAGWK